MITPSFSLTSTERVLPKLALDFTTASLDGRVTFTRTTDATHPATYVNNSGFIASALDNAPRFDHDPITLACKGLLVEESRTNLLTYSSVFNNAAWTAGARASITVDQVTSPDNSLTGNLFSCTATGAGGAYIYRTVTTTALSVSFSVYAKVGNNGYLVLELADGTNDVIYGFNLNSGAVGSSIYSSGWTGVTPSITALKNGWYRCTLSATRITTTNVSCYIYGTTNSASSYACTSGQTNYIWGAQLEAGTFPTSYIPTTSAALTRNADVATMTGTNFSDWWQASRGGVLVRARPGTISGVRPWVQFDDGTVNEIIALRGNTTNSELYIVDGGTPQAQIDAGTIAANTAYSLTGWWQTNFCAARKDSGARVEDLTATIPTVTQARLGSDGTNYLNGHLASINYYDQFSGQIYTRRKNKAIFTII